MKDLYAPKLGVIKLKTVHENNYTLITNSIFLKIL